jgi:hypothetical protein
MYECFVYMRAAPVDVENNAWGPLTAATACQTPPAQKLPFMITYENLCRFYSLFDYVKKNLSASVNTFQHLSRTFLPSTDSKAVRVGRATVEHPGDLPALCLVSQRF